MARLKNDLLKLIGSMGGLTFSQDEKGTIVKMKSSVSKERIKTHPRSAGTRNGYTEMGGASRAAKELRLGFLRHGKALGDRYFSGRLNGLMRKVVGLGAGKPGARQLDLRKNGALLEAFEFIKARPLLYSVGGLTEKPKLDAGRTRVTWRSSPLDRQEQVTAPEGATHIQFLLLIATARHYNHDAAAAGYVPVASHFTPCSALASSEPIALNTAVLESVMLQCQLPTTAPLPETVAVVSAVGVSFFKKVHGELLAMEGTGGMRIFGVG